ncbi:N utilization substance protein B [Paenibacillus selenitireducens]|uniref:Transcription antitermination protein NusB n=1 Tax=Paenibacillus selenitireducens TaxID=1324314 RepID=A0A1T2XNA0_9BACL|nr:transcription antitermination factor NusB [Paenibacillus selenitireducens]OPA81344.1 N utilization substance protein B [Paenibacillus selenitireducens]
MKRRLAREITVQSLYQMEMNGVEAEEAVAMVLTEVKEDNETEIEIRNFTEMNTYVLSLVQGTWANKERIDQLLSEYLKGWQVERLSRVDRQILRLACFEMVFSDDVPPKVVVNEAIDVAKHFGTDESGKFVNGVLGKMIRELEQIKAN